MLTVLDRYLIRSLVVNYLIAVAVMLCLYIVLDMFVNMDEFTKTDLPAFAVMRNIFDYYWPNLFLYFSQLSGVITSFACLAVLGRMRKQNELTAVMASGVSLYRVARPILAFGIAATALLVIDTELCIPWVAHKLSRDHDDVEGNRAYEVLFLRDRDGALLSARRFHPTNRDLERILVLIRDEGGDVTRTLEADRATWEPPTEMQPRGRWRLDRGKQVSRVVHTEGGLGPREDQVVTFPTYYESDLSPESIQLRQSAGWLRYLSLSQLRELDGADSADHAAILQVRHSRTTGPIVSLLLLLLGLPFFLDRAPVNMISDAGKCMLTCGGCYLVAFIAQSVHAGGGSALPSWIPIFIFGTVAMVLLDRVKT
ncbi:MAG: LptF/LptG family permease [Planctomycetes bacterium]|nr:LptF/LptG family permease [Planctomycetota bacterium]MBI3834680.1 LptF/LptG family permease [Planctomycetota bacterium]